MTDDVKARRYARPLLGAGRCGVFLVRAVGRMRFGRRQWVEIIRQVYFVGGRSLVIIVTCGFFVGLVLTLQIYDTLSRFGAGNSIGTVLALSLFRELGPVLTAILFAGRAGTSVTAEIGLMRATEQLDALELMAIDPMERIVEPRLLAGVVAVPALTLIFNLMAILGGVFFAIYLVDISPGVFWGNMQAEVNLVGDLLGGLLKAAVFGLIVSWLAVFFGWYARPTGEGVSLATTQTVIASAILVLLADFLLTALLL